MSLKNIDDNHELLNAYKAYNNVYADYLALPDKQKKEMNGIKTELLKAINNLESNDSFVVVASEEEKKEIQSIKDGLSAS